MFSSFLLIPQFAQAPESTGYGFGSSVTEAGLLLFPAAIAQLVAGPLAGRLGVVIGFRTTLAMGAGFAASAFVLLVIAHDASWSSSSRARCSAPASRSPSPRWPT